MRSMKISLATAIVLGAQAVFLTVPAAAADKVCKLEITGTDTMQFDKKELKVGADCTQVELTLKHSGKLPVTAMGHNWVLTESAAFQPVATAGMSAGLPSHYVPKDDARVIAHTKVIGGGESTHVTFPTSKLKKGGNYTFFCSFPGHWSLMKGVLTFG